MPLPQVSERIKEIPGQVLRVVFGSVGQFLMAADKARARLAEQLSGAGEPDTAEWTKPGGPVPAPPRTTAADPGGDTANEVTSATETPATKTPATKTPATKTPATGMPGTGMPGTGNPAAPAEPRRVKPGAARWRSLDKTGNVRVLGDDDTGTSATPGRAATSAGTGEESPGTALAEPEPEPASIVQRPAAVVAEPAPDELAQATPAELAEPAPAELAEPAPAAFPVAGYDDLSIASLRARLRFLDAAGVRTLLDYEKAHQGRPAVITMFERRIVKLGEGS